jgi:hypothetical protein
MRENICDVPDDGSELFAGGPHDGRGAEEGDERHVEDGFGERVVVTEPAEVPGKAPQHQEHDAVTRAGDAQDKG